MSPPQPDFSLQTGSRYIYSVSSERGILLFKARHSHWVQPHGEGATEKGFEKRWRLPTSEIHASLPCKEGHPATERPPYGKDKLVCRAICSFPLSTGRNVHLQIKKWSRHTKHSRAGLKGPAPVPWERAWPQGTLWSAGALKPGCSRVHWLGGGREGKYTPWSVLFPLGSVLGVPVRKDSWAMGSELPSDLLLIADILLAFPMGLRQWGATVTDFFLSLWRMTLPAVGLDSDVHFQVSQQWDQDKGGIYDHASVRIGLGDSPMETRSPRWLCLLAPRDMANFTVSFLQGWGLSPGPSAC